MANTYFAAETPDRIGDALYKKVTQRGDSLPLREYDARNRKAYLYYYGTDYSGVHATSQVLRDGQQGELAAVRVNHSRALVNTLRNVVSSNKVDWQAEASNAGYDAIAEEELASNVLEYYWKDRQVNTLALLALEKTIAFAESFVFSEWDTTLGEDFANVDGRTHKTGDVRYTQLSTWDVIRDSTHKAFDECTWFILRMVRNKWDLAARVELEADASLPPEEVQARADAIRKLSPSSEASLQLQVTGSGASAGRHVNTEDSDNVPYYVFLHKPTPAVPEGREVVFCDAKTVLVDRPLPYSAWPLHRCPFDELIGTPYAYTPFWDILGIQEVTDSLHSILSGNITTFGSQCIAAVEGTEIAVDTLANGMTCLYYPPGSQPPQALQLVKCPPEAFSYLKELGVDQQKLISLSGVVRGEADFAGMSGSALALLQAQTINQSSTLQNNWLRFIESIGLATVELFKRNATQERKIALSGATGTQSRQANFTRQQLGSIHKVTVDIGNPLSQTVAGRTTIAEHMMQLGVVKTPQEYNEVITTGRLEPLLKSSEHELRLITFEAEQIQRGETPVLSPDDDHALHMKEHRVVMASPEARANPAVVQAYTQHMQGHMDAYSNADPRRLLALGQQPLPPPPPPPMPPGMPPGATSGPPGPPIPPSGPPHGLPPGAAPGPVQPPPPPGMAPPGTTLPDMPRQPINPSTGQRFVPPGPPT